MVRDTWHVVRVWYVVRDTFHVTRDTFLMLWGNKFRPQKVYTGLAVSGWPLICSNSLPGYREKCYPQTGENREKGRDEVRYEERDEGREEVR